MRIAYLAPEIPALSATFVYHEILAVKESGIDVLPVSVHRPAAPATEECARLLAERTILLYEEGLGAFLAASLTCKLLHPLRYLAAASLLLSDMRRLGFFSRAAAGLVYRFLAATRLARILEQNGCCHLHAHFAHVPTDIAMYAAKLAGITFSFTSHANDLFERGWLLPEKVARSAKAMTISEFNRRFLVSRGADERNIAIIRCGVDNSRFGAKDMKVLSCVPVIGSLGRLVEKKGFDTLLQAAGIMARKGVEFRIEIAGNGPLENELKELAEREGISERITFLGPMANDRVPEWLSRLDLFVLACRIDSNGDMDGIPVALMEAMAAGVPVVSTSVSAIPELVIGGTTGLLAPPASPDAIADAAARLLEDEELRSRCIAGARRMVAGEFSEQENAKKISELFKSILQDNAHE